MNQNTISNYTSLSRILDPFHYRTNLVIMLATLIGGIIAGAVTLLTGQDIVPAILAGFYIGATIFITWVLSRETDPDNDYSAFVAAGLGFVFWTGRIEILSLATLIVLARILNRIVGPPAKLSDSSLALVLIAVSVFSGQWQMGLVGALIFGCDALLSQPLRSQFIFAGLSLALSVGFVATNGIGERAILTTPYAVTLLGVSVVFIIAILRTTHIRVPADTVGYRVDPRRVQALMAVCWVAGVFSVWWGDAGVNAFLPIWVMMAGVSLYRFTVARFIA